MLSTFSFATATQVLFGNNSIAKIPELVNRWGNRVLIVSGKRQETAHDLATRFLPGADVSYFQIHSEPTIEMIGRGVKIARSAKCEYVIGIGGGSVIDAAKAIAAMVPNPGELMDYLEVIGKGMPLVGKPLPCIAIPTTAGTGAEVTKNSVIKSNEKLVKVSLRSDSMYPTVALVDPVLTYSMSPELTASTGFDALTHLMETFVSNQANPFIDMICREGLKRVSHSLTDAFHDGQNSRAREDMSMASMLGGMALSNVKLGVIHGFAGPMGGMFHMAHGTICASLMAASMEMNIETLSEQKGDLSKFTELAQILTGSRLAQAEDGIVWVKNMVTGLKIPALSAFDISEPDFPALVEKAKASSSMKGNPVLLNNEQLFRILEKSM